jgi:hypothetical protein
LTHFSSYAVFFAKTLSSYIEYYVIEKKEKKEEKEEERRDRRDRREMKKKCEQNKQRITTHGKDNLN